MRKLIACIAALALAGCDIPYSDGVRVGAVYKFSRKGLFCRTWEGEMALPGYRVTDTSGAGNVFDFTVDNPTLIPKINAALESGAPIRITYRQVFLPLWCTTQSGYFVVAVN